MTDDISATDKDRKYFNIDKEMEITLVSHFDFLNHGATVTGCYTVNFPLCFFRVSLSPWFNRFKVRHYLISMFGFKANFFLLLLMRRPSETYYSERTFRARPSRTPAE